ncbi:hypothetical protein [Ralstonia sp. 1B3]|uniref:hypothetical protein n=1 Tax=Ralstonia sp. 1B3 TaxID=2997421 RepID=UPI002FCBF12C
MPSTPARPAAPSRCTPTNGRSQATSFFAAFGLVANGTTDIDVEDAHKAGIKGQGVNVLVLDDGIDVHNEDLFANANWT